MCLSCLQAHVPRGAQHDLPTAVKHDLQLWFKIRDYSARICNGKSCDRLMISTRRSAPYHARGTPGCASNLLQHKSVIRVDSCHVLVDMCIKNTSCVRFKLQVMHHFPQYLVLEGEFFYRIPRSCDDAQIYNLAHQSFVQVPTQSVSFRTPLHFQAGL